MKSFIVMLAVIFCTSNIASAQITNPTTASIKVYGNCEMCKNKIEKAGTVENVSTVVWSEETGMATITYNADKTNTDDILKKISLVGYDSDKFKAPDAVYKKLPGCCKYERAKATTTDKKEK